MRVISALFTGGLTFFLVRYLGPHDYGVYALALSVGGVLLLPADFGVTRSAARFIAERRADPAEVAGVLRQSLRLKAFGAGLVAVALIVASGPISNAYGVPSLETPLRVMALAIVVQSFMLLFTITFEAIGRNSVGFRLTFAESALEVSAALGLVLAGAGVTGALAGRAVGYTFGAVLGAVLLARTLGRPRIRGRGAEGLSPGRIARYAGTLFVIDAAFAAFGYIDVLLIGAFLDPSAAGEFNAPVQILGLTQYAGLALAAGVAPRLARERGGEPDVRAFQLGLRLLLGLQFMLVPPFLVWAPSIVDLALGPDYGASVDVLRVLSPYVLLMGVGPLIALGVNYLGEASARIPLALTAVAINALIDALLIPRIGIVAGAIGTDVAYLFFVVGHILIIRRLIDLPMGALGLSLLRLAAAGTAMAAVLFAFGTGKLPAGELVAGAILSIAAYFCVLLLTRELTRPHLRTAWGYASNAFRRYQS
jgi:O-antigen/teichoic acid export membrane protein